MSPKTSWARPWRPSAGGGFFMGGGGVVATRVGQGHPARPTPCNRQALQSEYSLWWRDPRLRSCRRWQS